MILHSDQGSQYSSKAFQNPCMQCGIRQSMGNAGDCHDNAMSEPWFATLKLEGLPMGETLRRKEARNRLIDCIEGSCSTRRFHSAVECRSSKEFEEELFGSNEISA